VYHLALGFIEGLSVNNSGGGRRLSAILAADVVGYTRLMELDTDGTVAEWKAARSDIIDPAVTRHSGRIVKHTGDGFLAEFPAVQDAVQCAVNLQQSLASGALDFRMGVNLGDIIDDGEDIHGEGVNIAARIEALAEPGGICISGMVYDSIRNRLDQRFEDTGEHDVKHVSAPVRVFRVVLDGGETLMSETDKQTKPDKPSIAVLPFDNMSGDPEQEYFSDGIAEDIITDLSKVSRLLVIARNSSFAYKGLSPDIRKVCRELGVRYVLEGSVRRSGNRVRINAQLINGVDGGHIWAERYDREMQDIFAVQDEVTLEIVAALRVELTPLEEGRLEGRSKVNPAALDHLYRGRSCLLKFTPDALNESRAMFERAIDIDPDIAEAYAMLSVILCTEYFNDWNNAGTDSLNRVLALAQKACEVDENDAIVQFALSLCQTWRGDLDAAQRAGERAIELDSNLAQGYTALGQALDFKGDHGRAAEMFQQGLLLDPQYDLLLHFQGRAQMAMGLYDQAEANFKRRIIRSPRTDMTRAYLAALYGDTGRIDEARQIWQELMEINPNFNVERVRTTLPYSVSNFFDRYFGGLKKADIID
jgi:adenylate cyclase